MVGEDGWIFNKGISGNTLFQDPAKQENVNVKALGMNFMCGTTVLL
jgi:hypothetical protein